LRPEVEIAGVRIVCISDTHSQLHALRVPDGDVLVHAGDATYDGTLEELKRFNADLESLRARFRAIVFVPGNHDFICEREPEVAKQVLCAATVLDERALEVDGVRLFGSPWQPWFLDWAYNFPKDDDGTAARATWAKIPAETELLITHGPPRGILDRTSSGRDVGCPHLRERLSALPELRLHVFGHIHEAYGEARGVLGEIHFVNASSCTLAYQPRNPPIVVDL
jgi:Icc-related predicted phosphoesterase